MLMFILFALLHFAFSPPQSYSDWRGWVFSPFVLMTSALFFVALLLHAWVGLRDVVLDYVKPLALRLTVLAALIAILLGLALWIMKVLLLAQH